MVDISNVVDSTINRIYKSYEDNENPRFGVRLGASQIGEECSKMLWLSFRWVVPSKFEVPKRSTKQVGQMLKLFERGQDEEERFIRDLKRVGIELKSFTEEGEQIRTDLLGGHFGGNVDGVGRGFLEAPKAWHIVEYKTHNDKSFQHLKKHGVQKSKPTHYAQMQTYMLGLGVNRGFYFAVNKNDDELYQERIEFDEIYANKLLKKAENIIFDYAPSPGISDTPDYYMCKMCRYTKVCHKKEKPIRNCRTCAHSTPLKTGGWYCEEFNKGITKEEQEKGCSDHRYLPTLIGTPIDLIKGKNVLYSDGYLDEGIQNG